VDVVEAYRTVAPEHLAEKAREILAIRPDCLTFTSSSTVRNLVQAAGAEALRGIAVASIGPITTETARQLGVEVATQAKVFTVDGLVEAVIGLYTEMTPPPE
jgi:uroporphyrinogen III methyltransferase/synthase